MTKKTLELNEISLKEVENIIKQRTSMEYTNLIILKNMLMIYKNLLGIMEFKGMKKDTELKKTELLIKKVTERIESIEECEENWGGEYDN